MKKFATLLPNYWLAETTASYFDEAWQTVGGKEQISAINWNFLK
ncbi:hypothetical protein [Peribacillus phoenicis]